MKPNFLFLTNLICLLSLLVSCTNIKEETISSSSEVSTENKDVESEISPLITEIYTADPSAHVFNNKLFIYPSHDYESGIPQDDLGSHFDMKDYHVFSMEETDGKVTDHGVVLSVEQVSWAKRQMWAPDAAEKNGKYYLYFPAKDESDIFRIGVATSDKPEGPFTPEESYIEGSYSIDPAVFKDSDGSYYMYFGGIWGGQLQRWQSGSYTETDAYPAESDPALSAKVVKLSEDMLSFAEAPRDVQLIDENGNPITVGDNERRFFEAAWVHYYNGKYYFSYSTGDTHNIAYGIGDNPYGPFTYQGVILKPVLGWTNHHSIVEYKGKWYLFFHDSSLSKGQTHLRSVKVTPLTYDENGHINTIDALVNIN